jgi:hypothetical protein
VLARCEKLCASLEVADGEALSLRGGRVDQAAHCRDAIAGDACTLGVLLDCGFVWSEVDAVHFVAGDVAVQPLDLRSHILQDRDRFFRQLTQLRVGEVSSSRDFAFDYEFGHEHSLEAFAC